MALIHLMYSVPFLFSKEELIMACFVAPMAEAIVTTIVKKTTEKKGYNPEEHPSLKRINWLNGA